MPSLGQIRSHCILLDQRRTAWIEYYMRKHPSMNRAKAFVIADAKVRKKITWPPDLN